ncbi:hypothetical protein DL769_001240 [Monosporascus sp. CRB-8-3]|nr:hypothetical protein DL769_001240 [Monosporascus sp. CRB-8-3]
MPVNIEKPMDPTPRQSPPHMSTEPNAEELTKKLSVLSCNPLTPPGNLKQQNFYRNQDGSNSFEVRSLATKDSGYGSLVSTPNTNKSLTEGPQFPARHPSSRDILDKPIPKDLNDRFLDFKILYTEALWKSLSGKRGRNLGDISMKLRYKGETEADAQLYIVVQCERRILRKVKKFFDNSDVRETLGSDFRLHFIDSGLIRLLSSDTATVSSSPGNIRDTMCGTAIEMSLGGDSRRATLGGLIVVITTKKSLYALTAGHPLASLGTDPSKCPSDWSDESDWEGSDADEDYIPLQLPGSAEDIRSQEFYNPCDQKIQIGTIKASSFRSIKREGNHDWALVELSNEYWAPNCLSQSSTGRGTSEERRITVAVDADGARHKDHCCVSDLSLSTLEIHLSKQPAVVLSCRGIQRGTLSSNHTALLISPSNGFVETLDFLPDPTSSLATQERG